MELIKPKCEVECFVINCKECVYKDDDMCPLQAGEFEK